MDKNRISIGLQHQGVRERMNSFFRKVLQNTFGAWKPHTRLKDPEWLNN